jgi:exodeoxyribonuclease V alpha subunit
MSSLAPALLDSLLRLLPPSPATRLDPAGQLALRQVVTALAGALERGELGLDLEGPPPPELEELGAASGEAASTTSAGQATTTQPHTWPTAQLAALQACGWLVESSSLEHIPEGRSEAPVVRAGRWLRWRRWHQQLSHCTTALIQRGQAGVEPPASASQLKEARGRATAAGLDRQQSAAVQALLEQRLVLLSGGPGTGKTSTVVQMLAAALRLQPQLRLQLAAPTGKAAARLGAAVAAGAAGLEPGLAERLAGLPCGTLHRLLEARGNGAGFRRGAALPLELDLLVVDEVSMVDLPLMQALLAALPQAARLLLVGDPGQLPPVGPGAVLLELCRPDALAALGPAAVELRTTYRNDGAIATLASTLRSQVAPGSVLLQTLRPQLEQLQSGDNVQWLEALAGRPPADALARLRQHQQRLTERADALGVLDPQAGPADGPGAQALLNELERLMLLSPIRQGPWGVEGVQRALLGEALTGPVQAWPLGTPVLNRRNLPEQELANGDIGVLVTGAGGRQLVLFPGGRLLHPAQLAGAEPALALTVHKAQGSQYGEVLLLLPAGRHLDARLLYTGLTRARSSAHLYTALRSA